MSNVRPLVRPDEKRQLDARKNVATYGNVVRPEVASYGNSLPLVARWHDVENTLGGVERGISPIE